MLSQIHTHLDRQYGYRVKSHTHNLRILVAAMIKDNLRTYQVQNILSDTSKSKSSIKEMIQLIQGVYGISREVIQGTTYLAMQLLS